MTGGWLFPLYPSAQIPILAGQSPIPPLHPDVPWQNCPYPFDSFGVPIFPMTSSLFPATSPFFPSNSRRSSFFLWYHHGSLHNILIFQSFSLCNRLLSDFSQRLKPFPRSWRPSSWRWAAPCALDADLNASMECCVFHHPVVFNHSDFTSDLTTKNWESTSKKLGFNHQKLVFPSKPGVWPASEPAETGIQPAKTGMFPQNGGFVIVKSWDWTSENGIIRKISRIARARYQT